MYAKIFTQIFDSSIAENYVARHVFEDLLKLADKTGVVDMTAEAICRRTNAPNLKIIKDALTYLSRPDKASRSKTDDGRRIRLIDSRRDWGWLIINYEHYRAIQDEEARRATWRDAKAKQRLKMPVRKSGVDKEWVTQGDLKKDEFGNPILRDNPFSEGEE